MRVRIDLNIARGTLEIDTPAEMFPAVVAMVADALSALTE